jgi:hypothetical protein
MTQRFYFDLQQGDELVDVDEEGMELKNFRAALKEASRALDGFALLVDGTHLPELTIEVRDANGHVTEVKRDSPTQH